MKTIVASAALLVTFGLGHVWAQEYKFDDNNAGGYGRGTLSVEKRPNGYLVTGSFYGEKQLICRITGTYYPTTGRVKGWCSSGGMQLHQVTGAKFKETDGFQLNIGGTTYRAYRSDTGVSGSWRIEQTGGGRTYRGTLTIKQDGIKITGSALWDNHQQGSILGQVYQDNSVSFTISYGDGLEGYYRATLGKNGVDMVGGTAKANKGGTTVSWFAKRVSQ